MNGSTITDQPDPPIQRTGPRICLVASPGGHLAQLEKLSEALAGFDMYLVTISSPYVSSVLPGIRQHLVKGVARNPTSLIVNLVQSLVIFLRERPDLVITTGAGDALPTVFAARLLGREVVFVESMARVWSPSVFGRLVWRLCSVVVVQWAEMLRAYPTAIVASPLFQPRKRVLTPQVNPSILVLTGSGSRGYDRLLAVVDGLVEKGQLGSNVFAQTGNSRYVPRRIRHERFMTHEAVLDAIRSHDIVITHDGSASMGEAIEAGKRVIVVPRSFSKGELTYRSDQELARRLASMNWITLLDSAESIPSAILGEQGTSDLGSSPTAMDTRNVVLTSVHQILSRSGKFKHSRHPAQADSRRGLT